MGLFAFNRSRAATRKKKQAAASEPVLDQKEVSETVPVTEDSKVAAEAESEAISTEVEEKPTQGRRQNRRSNS